MINWIFEFTLKVGPCNCSIKLESIRRVQTSSEKVCVCVCVCVKIQEFLYPEYDLGLFQI